MAPCPWRLRLGAEALLPNPRPHRDGCSALVRAAPSARQALTGVQMVEGISRSSESGSDASESCPCCMGLHSGPDQTNSARLMSSGQPRGTVDGGGRVV